MHGHLNVKHWLALPQKCTLYFFVCCRQGTFKVYRLQKSYCVRSQRRSNFSPRHLLEWPAGIQFCRGIGWASYGGTVQSVLHEIPRSLLTFYGLRRNAAMMWSFACLLVDIRSSCLERGSLSLEISHICIWLLRVSFAREKCLETALAFSCRNQRTLSAFCCSLFCACGGGSAVTTRNGTASVTVPLTCFCAYRKFRWCSCFDALKTENLKLINVSLSC